MSNYNMYALHTFVQVYMLGATTVGRWRRGGQLNCSGSEVFLNTEDLHRVYLAAN